MKINRLTREGNQNILIYIIFYFIKLFSFKITNVVNALKLCPQPKKTCTLNNNSIKSKISLSQLWYIRAFFWFVVTHTLVNNFAGFTDLTSRYFWKGYPVKGDIMSDLNYIRLYISCQHTGTVPTIFPSGEK